MKKKTYIQPQVETISIPTSEILTASGGNPGGGDGGDIIDKGDSGDGSDIRAKQNFFADFDDDDSAAQGTVARGRQFSAWE